MRQCLWFRQPQWGVSHAVILMRFPIQVKILTVDVDAEKEFATSLKVAAMPTIMFVGTAPASSPALLTHVRTDFRVWNGDGPRWYRRPIIIS